MAEKDFVVSCWYIPLQGKRSLSGYSALLSRYADALDGMLYQEGSDLRILVDDITLAPGDTLCRYRSGRSGVKRGGR